MGKRKSLFLVFLFMLVYCFIWFLLGSGVMHAETRERTCVLCMYVRAHARVSGLSAVDFGSPPLEAEIFLGGGRLKGKFSPTVGWNVTGSAFEP